MRRIALLAAIVALAACSNDATSPSVSLVGTYSLRTINGNPLPFTFSSGSMLVSDRLSLNADNSYVDIATFSNGSTSTEQGFWSSNNNVITFNDQTDNIQYTGSLSGSVLTEIFNNTGGFSGSVIEVYQKD